MTTQRWLLALPIALAACLVAEPAEAGTVRDRAGLFSSAAAEKAQAQLERIQRETGISATVETVDSLDGRSIEQVLPEHAKRAGETGVYVLIAKKEAKIRVEASRRLGSLNGAPTRTISQAFLSGLKNRDFDKALEAGVSSIQQELATAKSAGPPSAPVRGVPVPRADRGSGFNIGSLVGIGLLVFGALMVFRLLGSLFGGGQAGGYFPGRGGPMGGPGYGGPGYGGYGGGGGGFLSGLFGGLGGAIAGNWIYDQFRGHGGGDHAGYGSQASSYDPGQTSDDWGGGGGTTADWGGGDAGGDWGSGDAGGGDWGGSGGDWGGGGGDGGDW